MTGPNPQDMIDELKYDIQVRDERKARIVLSYFGQTDDKTQNRLLFELSRVDPGFSVPLMCHLLATHSSMDADFPIIKEMLISKLLDVPALLLSLLQEDIDPAEKAIYFEVAGEMRFEAATPTLLSILYETENVETIKQIISALGAIGDPGATSALADYLYSDKPELVVLAVDALGQICTPTAMHRLSERMGTDHELDRTILQIFSNVQDTISLQKLNDTIRSHNANLRNFAKATLVKIGSKAVPLLTENLLYDDPDLQIHSLNILGETADPSAIAPIRKLLFNEPKNANVRFAAYEALALLPLRQGAYTLAAGLTDPEEHVRIAAARAIDRNLSDILKAGIKNMVKLKDKDAQQIVKTIVNAQADAIFTSLVPEAYFEELAVVHLTEAHGDIRQHYRNLLRRIGFSEFADRITPEEKRPASRLRVCAVDDSRMILTIYKNTLHELGYESVLFEFPESALQWLEKNKPDIVLTDLNMPETTGIELTERIRKRYAKKVLPVIMVTTQNESQDFDTAHKAGVNEILHKPFNADSLNEVITRYTQTG